MLYIEVMRAEVIAIGTELLLGFTPNSDAATLGGVLAGLGIDCYHHVTVGDNRRRLASDIETALGRSDLVITCGGLGPTVDDITLETIASVTRRPLLLNRKILKAIRSRFARLKIKMPKTNVRQALIPQGAAVFPNEVGTAPGFMLKLKTQRGQTPLGDRSQDLSPGSDPRLLVALPGPPAELIPMVAKHLIPRLRRYTGKTLIRSRTLKLAGITESEVDAKVSDILKLKGTVTVGIYAHPGQVDLRITAKAPNEKSAHRLIAGVESKIRGRLKNLIFAADQETLEAAVGKLLKARRLTLGIAESCTGGLIQHRITEVPGSSDYFRGGLISYSNDLKISILGVPAELLRKRGAVSPQVAAKMALGIRYATGSDIGLSVTGIAGPTGGTRKKPVGLVYIGLSTPKRIQAFRHQFSGDRSTVKFKSSQATLNIVRLHLLSLIGSDPGGSDPMMTP